MTRGKRVIQTIGLFGLCIVLLASSGGYGHTADPKEFPPIIPLNAFGSCPDAINDWYLKDSGGRPTFAVPDALDLIRAQLRLDQDAAGQEKLSAEWQVNGTVPPSFTNALSVYFFPVDADNNSSTGQRDGIFGLGMDLAFTVQWSRGRQTQPSVLVWGSGGGNPATVSATVSFDAQRQRIIVEASLTAINAQFLRLRGTDLTLSNQKSAAYTVYFRNNTSENAPVDVFPERGLKGPFPRPGIEFVDKELLLRFADLIDQQEAQARARQLGLEPIRFFRDFNILHARIVDGTETLAKVNQLDALADIEAEHNGIWCLFAAPNDPGFSMQWNLLNRGQSHPVGRGGNRQGVAGADIGISRAWDAGRTDSSSVLIGVIDSGVDLTHADLMANLRTDLGRDFIRNDDTPEDNIGHGAFVASLIGATGNNGAILAGVNWKASLVPLKAADKLSFLEKVIRLFFGVTWDDFLEAMEWVIQLRREGHNLRVINFSAGGPMESKLLDEVIQTDMNGILFVTAAGNDGNDLDVSPLYPCSYAVENILCVAASTDDDQLANFSNYSSSRVHLAAPGADVVGLIPAGLRPDTETLLGNAESSSVNSLATVAVSNGTSFSAPHAAAVAALIFANCPEAITSLEVKQAILEAVQHLPALEGKVITGGRLRWPEQLPSSCQGG